MATIGRFDCWGGNNDSFISQTGTLGVAANFTRNTNDALVGGVNFVSVAELGSTTLNGITVQTTGISDDNDNAFGDGEFSGDAEIQDLLQGGHFGVNTVDFTGLVIGELYEIQIFANDARNNRNNGFILGLGDGTQSFALSQAAGTAGFAELNNSTLTANNTNVDDGIESGDFIIGTFIADATTQSFATVGDQNSGTFGDNGASQINGIQLRIVPEPSALLSLLSLLLLSFFGRRKRILSK